jgi:hypothetical protein
MKSEILPRKLLLIFCIVLFKIFINSFVIYVQSKTYIQVLNNVNLLILLLALRQAFVLKFLKLSFL